MSTTILVMNAAPLVQMPRRFLSFGLAVIVNDFAGISGLHESRPVPYETEPPRAEEVPRYHLPESAKSFRPQQIDASKVSALERRSTEPQNAI